MATRASPRITRYRHLKGIHTVPTMAVRNTPINYDPGADFPTDMENIVWMTAQAASRATYLWLTGKITPEGDLERYSGTYKRISMPAPPANTEHLLPYQKDPRRLPSDAQPGVPHLRDSVRITESKARGVSTVTHAKEAYWAFFVEFGHANPQAGGGQVAPNPKWVPAAREARKLYIEQTEAAVNKYMEGFSILSLVRSDFEEFAAD